MYTDFGKNIGLLDGKTINATTSDTEFLAINKRTKHSTLNPGVALVRFQFMEILLRLAIKKYYESNHLFIHLKYIANEAQSISQAVRIMYEKNLCPLYGNTDAQKWREERLWNEEVDNLYKSHFPIFDQLFKVYGCHYLKPGDKPFMMQDEFQSIFSYAGLVNDQLDGRDIAISFNTAMMTQIDELNKDRHLKATMVEFLEAFSRACDKLSLPPSIDEEVIKLLY